MRSSVDTTPTQVLILVFVANKEDDGSVEFREYRRHIYHDTLAYVLESLREGITTPEVVRYPDGHYRRTLYIIGPYIADYPEQALLACIVSGWCPR